MQRAKESAVTAVTALIPALRPVVSNGYYVDCDEEPAVEREHCVEPVSPPPVEMHDSAPAQLAAGQLPMPTDETRQDVDDKDDDEEEEDNEKRAPLWQTVLSVLSMSGSAGGSLRPPFPMSGSDGNGNGEPIPGHPGFEYMYTLRGGARPH